MIGWYFYFNIVPIIVNKKKQLSFSICHHWFGHIFKPHLFQMPKTLNYSDGYKRQFSNLKHVLVLAYICNIHQ